ncbi:MAG: cupin domain-containing protein [Chloroflexota bacterium]|nr:cupin domain-containing protein [Chloroflexota bacterium]
MRAFELAEIETAHAAAGRLYHEFLREPSLSLGLYVLPAGGIDPQSPHDQDEVYYVLRGNGKIEVAGETRAVGAGSIVFVAANVEHRFSDITEELAILVFFAPAEASG